MFEAHGTESGEAFWGSGGSQLTFHQLGIWVNIVGSLSVVRG